jgi:stage II sporulation protein D
MVKKIVLLAVCCVFWLGPATAGEKIRVAVDDNQRIITLRSKAGLIVDGRPGGSNKTITASRFGSRPVRVRSTSVFLEMNGRSYRGLIEVRRRENGLLLAVNELDIEDYLRGVVASEIPHAWELEALKAQAVASRTFALYQKRTAGSRPYHIVATVEGQVYDGRRGERQAADRAVQETAGEVLTYGGEVIPAFYHSSCGGQTESAFELWGLDVPYLQGVDCECQRISQYGEWERRFSPAQIAAALGKIGYRLDSLSEATIAGITPAGRVKQVVFRYPGGAASIPAEKFRSAVGTTSIPSVFFDLELSGGEIVISGRGMGHGVGLCQWGAQEMALRGQDYRSILEHYYPGTRLKKRGTTGHERQTEKKAAK